MAAKLPPKLSPRIIVDTTTHSAQSSTGSSDLCWRLCLSPRTVRLLPRDYGRPRPSKTGPLQDQRRGLPRPKSSPNGFRRVGCTGRRNCGYPNERAEALGKEETNQLNNMIFIADQLDATSSPETS